MLWFLIKGIRGGLLSMYEETLYEQAPSKKNRQPVPGQDEKTWRVPVIYIGNLPPKRSNPEAPEDFPYMLVRVAGGMTTEDGTGARAHTAKLILTFGTWTDEGEEAEQINILQMHYRALQWLSVTRLIDAQWERQLPISWGYGLPAAGDTYQHGAQPYEYSVGWIEVSFQLRAEIDDIGPDFDKVYGTAIPGGI